MKNWGICLLIVGLAMLAISLFLLKSTVSTETMSSIGGTSFATGEFSETYNLPAAASREMVFHTGIAILLIGAIFFAAGAIEERLQSLFPPTLSPGAGISRSADISDNPDPAYIAPDPSEGDRNKAIIGAGIAIIFLGGMGWAITANMRHDQYAGRPQATADAAQNASDAADNAMNAALNASEYAAAVSVPARSTRSEMADALSQGREFGRQYSAAVAEAMEEAEGSGTSAFDSQAYARSRRAEETAERQRSDAAFRAAGIDPDADRKVSHDVVDQ